jgi:hypothetical protein
MTAEVALCINAAAQRASNRPRLTDADIEEIRRDYRRHSRTHGSGALARRHNVTPAHIRHIVAGRRCGGKGGPRIGFSWCIPWG